MKRPVKRPARGKVAAKAKSAARTKSAAKAKPAAKAQSAAKPQPAVPAAPEPVAKPATVSPFHLTLEASCTLRETADLQFSLVAAGGDPVVVDGGAVQRIDTAGLQLLVAFARRQRDAGRRLEWKSASPELVKCGRRLGLLDALGLAASAGETP